VLAVTKSVNNTILIEEVRGNDRFSKPLLVIERQTLLQWCTFGGRFNGDVVEKL